MISPIRIEGKINFLCGAIDRDSRVFSVVKTRRSFENYTKQEDIRCQETLRVFNSAFSKYLRIRRDLLIHIETSRLKGPTIHEINNPHTDRDQYGEGLTFLFYPRIDDTIEQGRLRIIHSGITKEEIEKICNKVNFNIGYDILSYEYLYDSDNEKYEWQFIFNNRSHDNMVPFIIMDSRVVHQVEEINGTGIRECVFMFLDATFK